MKAAAASAGSLSKRSVERASRHVPDTVGAMVENCLLRSINGAPLPHSALPDCRAAGIEIMN